jgi:hypothetical protein
MLQAIGGATDSALHQMLAAAAGFFFAQQALPLRCRANFILEL